MPRDKIILSYDEQFEVPRFGIKFDGFYESTMRIWPDRLLRKEVIEKTRTISISSFSSSSGIDTVFSKSKKKMIKIIAYPCHREQIEVREKDQIVKKLKSVDPYELCSSCVVKRYILNFRAIKFCMREIPSYLKNVAVDFDYFFKRKITLRNFFYVQR